MPRASAPLLVVGVLVSLGACRQIAGIDDIELSPDAGADGGHPREGGAREGGANDAGICGCEKCVTLATGLDSPLSMVLVGTDIYFLNYGPEEGQGSLGRVSTTGGKVDTIVGGLTHPLSLTTDGTNLYYFTEDATNGGVIEERAISGFSATVDLATHQGMMTGLVSCETIQYPTTQFIAVSSSDVYWIGTSGGVGVNVMKVPIGGGASAAFVNALPGEAGLASVFEPVAITTDDKSLFVISNNLDDFAGIIQVPLATGEASAGQATTVIEDLTSPDSLALTSTDIVFTDEAISFTNGTLQTVPRTGGITRILAKMLTAPWAVAADTVDAYWINSGNGNTLGSIEKVALGGGTAATLATGLQAAEAMALDAANVYWVDSTCGTVMKVAK